MPSIKQALNSSGEALTGKFKLGTIPFIHSTVTARWLAGVREKRRRNSVQRNKTTAVKRKVSFFLPSMSLLRITVDSKTPEPTGTFEPLALPFCTMRWSEAELIVYLWSQLWKHGKCIIPHSFPEQSWEVFQKQPSWDWFVQNDKEIRDDEMKS